MGSHLGVWGGAESEAEMMSIVGEKVEATNTLMTGDSHSDVIARYREFVADNTRRFMP